ncbi:hypothetical protein GN244_ATG06976 [Phytophthora infestans]|uniref:Transmembrane protein n=1 Tax=Phytophthora infestans TaxID=4787 RepID=A0A833SX57_PHYIN|nr:hypothetical protein GN244_ATG06976 [Phytophthora infestans]KAF4148017.1 hypothetical protein GN958_ATG02827 [Phytophthora infestans]
MEIEVEMHVNVLAVAVTQAVGNFVKMVPVLVILVLVIPVVVFPVVVMSVVMMLSVKGLMIPMKYRLLNNRSNSQL